MSAAHAQRDGGPFASRLMFALVGLGVLAFIVSLVMGAYAPNMRSGKDGGPHALSNAATGFSGIVQLAEATGRGPRILRNVKQLYGEELAVVTPANGSVPLGDILKARGSRATLIILPKWQAERRRSPSGWVAVKGVMPELLIENVLAPEFPIEISRRRTERQPLQGRSPLVPSAGLLREPAVVQTISGYRLQPLIVDSKGATVLGKAGRRNIYLLSDPDLLNNHGLASRDGAKAALALLDDLNSTGADGLLFDVTANGFGGTRNPLQLLFDPPFLAITLILFAALLLAGWQALTRFGAPALPVRSIAFGKAALVDNSAALVRKAGREPQLGDRYADLVRQRAAGLFHLPATLSAYEIDEALDRLRPDRPFSKLATAIGEARDRSELTVAARALSGWLQEIRT